MSKDSRGTVVPFAPVGRRTAPGRVRAALAANAAPWLDCWPPLDDAGLNADWDRLVALVMQAWCWRDPESIEAVDACLGRLRALVARDWS